MRGSRDGCATVHYIDETAEARPEADFRLQRDVVAVTGLDASRGEVAVGQARDGFEPRAQKRDVPRYPPKVLRVSSTPQNSVFCPALWYHHGIWYVAIVQAVVPDNLMCAACKGFPQSTQWSSSPRCMPT